MVDLGISLKSTSGSDSNSNTNSVGDFNNDMNTDTVENLNGYITIDHKVSKKRNRVSFVCQNCRKSKTKCDREQPHCSRCIKHGHECIYDIEFQKKPKTPSKNAIIKRLESDLEKYKNKFANLTKELEMERNKNSANIQSTSNINQNPNNDMGSSRSTSSAPSVPDLNGMTVEDDIASINFYNNHPSLIINDIMKREVKPLAENYIVLQDKFLSVLISSIFLDPFKNSMITALSDTSASISSTPHVHKNILKLKDILMKQNYSKQKKKRISDFINRILQKDSFLRYNNEDNTSDSTFSSNYNNSNEGHIKSSENKSGDFKSNGVENFEESMSNLGVSQLSVSMFNNFQHQYLEDSCTINSETGAVEYSALMKTFINEIESLLPPYEVILNYKAYFYEFIFPNLPFLDKDSFEETLSLVLFPANKATGSSEETEDSRDEESWDSNLKKVKINLGKSRLRTKLENLALLLIILKLSYISLRFNESDNEESSSQYISRCMLDKYPITNDTVLLVQRLLVSENYCACVNENIICLLLYVWSFFVFSPEEGDFFLEHPSDILSGIIIMLGNSIGLHRDPLDYFQLHKSSVDKRLLNQRRILWLGIVTISCLESSLKGRHPIFVPNVTKSFLDDINSREALGIYLERVKKDMGPIINERLLKIHEISFKRMQLSILITHLDTLFLTYGRSFRLSEFEKLRTNIKEFLDSQFPLLDTKGQNNTNQWIFQLTQVTPTEYSITLHSRMMGMLVLLRSSIATFLHYEALYNKTNSIKVLPYYKEYFYKSCIDCLTLGSHFEKFFNGGYGTKYSSLTSYNVTKTAQLALPSVIFSILSILIRFELAGVTLLTDYKNLSQKYQTLTNDGSEEYCKISNYMNELIGKITVINSLKLEFEKLLKSMHEIASEHLRFTYFSVFKMLALFDVVVNKLRKGHLLTSIIKMCQSELLHPKFVEKFSMTFNLDLSKRNTLLETLKKSNHLINLDVEYLNEMYQTFSTFRQNSPNGYLSFTKPASSSQDNIPTHVESNLETRQDYSNGTTSENKQDNNNFDTLNRDMNVNIQNPSDIQSLYNNSVPQNFNANNNLVSNEKNFGSNHIRINKIASTAPNSQPINTTSDWLNNSNSSFNIHSSMKISQNNIDISNNENNVYSIENVVGTAHANEMNFLQNGALLNGMAEMAQNNRNILPEPLSTVTLRSQSSSADTDTDVNGGVDFRDIFGGLDLFDYDFLFGGEK